jgi:PilZ domain-containing protein
MERSRPLPEDPRVSDQLGVMTRERHVRLLNCSVAGCLLETNRRLPVGAIASIRVTIDGRELTDDVQIVRCQPIAGAGETYHVGAQFLWTKPLVQQSLRSALRAARGEFAATIDV